MFTDRLVGGVVFRSSSLCARPTESPPAAPWPHFGECTYACRKSGTCGLPAAPLLGGACCDSINDRVSDCTTKDAMHEVCCYSGLGRSGRMHGPEFRRPCRDAVPFACSFHNSATSALSANPAGWLQSGAASVQEGGAGCRRSGCRFAQDTACRFVGGGGRSKLWRDDTRVVRASTQIPHGGQLFMHGCQYRMMGVPPAIAAGTGGLGRPLPRSLTWWATSTRTGDRPKEPEYRQIVMNRTAVEANWAPRV